MTVAELEDVTFDVEQDGEQVRRQLQRRVWERAGWATVAIVYEERAASGTWKAPKLALIRLRRVHEVWKKQASITLAGADAVALATTLDGWRDALAGTADTDLDDDAD